MGNYRVDVKVYQGIITGAGYDPLWWAIKNYSELINKSRSNFHNFLHVMDNMADQIPLNDSVNSIRPLFPLFINFSTFLKRS